MTDSDRDNEVQRLHEAEEELRQAKRQGARLTPVLDRLSRHLNDDAFAEQFMAAIEFKVRRGS